jgi:hypothetical protein
MSQRHVSLLSIAVLSFLLLFEFQNCAPATSPGASATSGDSTNVRIVDDLNKVELQFALSSVQVRDDAAVADVGGLCNRQRDGAALKWTVWVSAGQALLSGEASCDNGQFDLHMTGLDQMVCGVDHQLVVEGDWGGSASVEIQRRCEPLASEVISPPAGLPGGTECALEYVPADGLQNSCTQACYRLGQLVSQIPLAPDQCSGLAARLAGP